jgi:hypothetical protein
LSEDLQLNLFRTRIGCGLHGRCNVARRDRNGSIASLPLTVNSRFAPIPVMGIADHAVRGIHLTRLKPDGSDRERGDQAKIMIGHSTGAPIVLAPPNDLLGLAIGEGIEKVLAVHEVTGLGAWAAGSASRLPALADTVPVYIECVTVVVDDDPDGRRHAASLIQRLQDRRIEARGIVPNRWEKGSMSKAPICPDWGLQMRPEDPKRAAARRKTRRKIDKIVADSGGDPILSNSWCGVLCTWVEEHPQFGSPVNEGGRVIVSNTLQMLKNIVEGVEASLYIKNAVD